MEFNVCLEQFEGPLDLMLHLVRTSKLDLFDLNLDILASQYTQYIRQALDRALDVGSEYLVEFTTLMEYKSRKLLPRSDVQLEGQAPGEDPAALFARRLREYEQCKKEAEILEALHAQRSLYMERQPASMIDTWMQSSVNMPRLELSAGDLQKALLRVFRRYQILQPYETSVEIRELSVEERMNQIIHLPIFSGPAFLFERLLDDVLTLREAVVTFLALLELVHAGLACVWCTEKDEIWIRKLEQTN